MVDPMVALVRQAILTALDEASPRTGLAWDFNDDEQRVDFADRVASFIPSAKVPAWESCVRCGAAILSQHPEAEATSSASGEGKP